MKKWNLIVDVPKCSNCNNCTMAVKDEYIGNEFIGYSAPQPEHGHDWITIDRHIRGNDSMVDVNYVPRTCNHCDNAPCVAAGQGAVTKRQDGIVMIDPVKAKGRKDLVGSCPYGAIWWNEELGLPQQWTFDAHLLDAGWPQPRCAQACPSGAMRAIKVGDTEMAVLVKEENIQVLKPELNTRPRVYYRGLEKVTHNFLGGNVAIQRPEGGVDNVEGAVVELTLDGTRAPLRARTDAYGDFKFDGLKGIGETYNIRIDYAQGRVIERSGVLKGSQYLGTIEVEA